jgi:hypothetical protein
MLIVFLAVVLCTLSGDSSYRLLGANKHPKELYILPVLIVIFLNFSTFVLSLAYMTVTCLNNLCWLDIPLYISLKRSLRA